MGFLSKFFDSNARDIAKYQVVVAKINKLEAEYEKLSDAQMRAKTDELRQRVQGDYKKQREAAEPAWTAFTDQQRREADRKIYDPILDATLPEAFALVREAAKRTLKMRHYDVQIIGCMVLHDGRIAEMRTGEGKTLVATGPLYLNALLGKGAHLVTANDYLSKRDAVWNAPVYHLLGMSVGIIQGQSPETGDEGGTFLYDPDFDDGNPAHQYARPLDSRKEAYECDITYGTNNEYGFDYLRDNMEFSAEELRQRELHYAIVDEVDSILIDEARTPLIISGMVEQSTQNYYVIDRIVVLMKRGIDDPKGDKDNPNADKLNPDIHYVVDEKAKTATITDAGVAFMEKAMGVENLSEQHEWMHYIQASLKAHGVFRKDIDYVVKDNGEGPEIIIVDENTGRLMFGRRYSDGLHQAIEAKEHVEVKNESQTLATITFQNYFRLYSKLAGMTGTAKTEEDEFRKIYALDVVQVPTNKPIQRADSPDIIYKSQEHKLRGITAEILRIFCKQQPVLVGTRSIEMSEKVSDRLSPTALATLCMIEVAREQLETSKSVSADKKKEYTALLNQPLMNEKNRANLSVSRLKPLLKELNLSDDPLSPASMNAIARIFEVQDAGLERLEEALSHGIEHRILNAKFHEKEAIIIAEAGRKGSVTIATNMAGRGVDILLGGKHINQELPPVDGSEKSLKQVHAVEDDEEIDAEGHDDDRSDYRRFGKPSVLSAVTTGDLTDVEHKKAGDEVRKLGGLFILGTERHESRRIDNQLRGRAGRQGDPGESRFFVSLEDELWRLFGDRANHPLLRTWDEHLAMDAKMLSGMIQRAQKKVEEHYFESRKHVLNYDDVMNRQRELIYKERRRILNGVDLKGTISSYIRENIEAAVRTYTRPDIAANEWDMDELFRELDEYFMLYPVVMVDDLKGKTPDEMIAFLSEHIVNVYQSREAEMVETQGPEAMRQLERWMALRAVNDRWMEHLANMDYLREGIGLRGYEQKDPLLIYQKEAFDEFERMQQAIQDDIVRNLFRMQLVAQPTMPDIPQLPPNAAPAIPLPGNLSRPKTNGANGNGANGSNGNGSASDTNGTVTALPASAPNLPRPRQVITNLDTQLVGSGTASGKRADGAPADWKGGRNDECWCGSGLKYKKCHGKL